MTSHLVSIDTLPTELTFDQTIEIVHRQDLDWLENKLRQGLSVLVECDKQLTLYLYRAIRKRLKRGSAEEKLRCRLLSGHLTQAEIEDNPMVANQSLMQRIIRQLQTALFSGETDTILVLPHLDILTTTTKSGLSAETRETAAMLYENPHMVYLGFKDPNFELPKVIENVFPAKRSLVGLQRESIPRITLQREARKFGVEEFNPFALYKYVSGLNAIRFRQILGHIASYLDYDPANPGSVHEIYNEIRQMTLLGDLEVPRVDLDNDIGGYDKVKEKLKTEILTLLHQKEESENADTIKQIEEIVPKGMIFYGPPGTGKTFFAKAIATALDATITIVSGPELKSKWVGESEENLRRVFAQARKSAPAIIVFDELDSFASARGTYTSSGVEHSMVNQLLTEMDGFRKEELVFIVGTTNFMSSLDPALLRPGRFELSIHIPFPNKKDRRAIIEIYKKKFDLNLSDEMMDLLVQKTNGYVDDRQTSRYSGDHLYAITRGLKREELRRGEKMEITEADLDKAISGRKKKPAKLQKQEERTIAVHEAGHAIAAYVLPNCPTIEKITIQSEEDNVLGYVMQEVRENRYITTRLELLEDICVLMGGRIAEQMLIGDISVGSYDDLQRASEIARMMIEDLGMGENLGLRTYGKNARELITEGARRPISDKLAQEIDEEIREVMKAQQKRAKALLEEYRAELDKLIEFLLEHKTAKLEDLKEIFGGKEFKKSSKKAEGSKET